MVAVAQGSMLPHVNLSLQRDFYSQEDLFGDDARSWTLGVYATWDIFKGMQNIGEIKKAKAQQTGRRVHGPVRNAPGPRPGHRGRCSRPRPPTRR